MQGIKLPALRNALRNAPPARGRSLELLPALSISSLDDHVLDNIQRHVRSGMFAYASLALLSNLRCLALDWRHRVQHCKRQIRNRSGAETLILLIEFERK